MRILPVLTLAAALMAGGALAQNEPKPGMENMQMMAMHNQMMAKMMGMHEQMMKGMKDTGASPETHKEHHE